MMRLLLVLFLCGGLSCAKMDNAGELIEETEKPCIEPDCPKIQCPPGENRILRGKTTYPNGRDPLGNAFVYIPLSDTLPQIPSGVSCDLCSGMGVGRTVATTISSTDGSFELRGVPSGDAIPLVVQKGRFRRLVHVRVPPCGVTTLDTEQTRLPRNRSEGNLPRMAVSLGRYDAIECVLRNIGISDEEFGTPNLNRSIHLYENDSSPAYPGKTPLPDLMESLNRLSDYQMLFINCAGGTYTRRLLADAQVRQNLVEYLKKGGRMYATDWSYDFIGQLPELSPFICFKDDQDCSVTTPHGLGTAGFSAYGGAMGNYLLDVLPAEKGLSDFLSLLKPPVPSKGISAFLSFQWVQVAQLSPDQKRYPSKALLQTGPEWARQPMTVTFDYPPGAGCGRVLFSSYHTRERISHGLFPSYCPTDGMVPQEWILEYLLLDLADCIGPPG